MIPYWWAQVAPHCKISTYGHRTDRQARIEISSDAPRTLFGIGGTCANCGRVFNPIRERDDGSAYIRVTCGRDGCSRNERARQAYTDLLTYLRSGDAPKGAQMGML